MNPFTPRAACVVLALVAAVRLEAATLEFVPLDGLPPAVAALGAESEIEAYAIDPAGSIAMAAITSAGEIPASALRYARGADEPRVVPLGGRVVGLAVVGDGSVAYAVVRVTGRKGVLRSVDLVRIDLQAARASSVATLPPTAAGLSSTADGATLLIASKDEIRTFVIPGISSGPLYKALGDNVGVFPIERTPYVVVAQRSRVALVDLSAPQSRDGLALSEVAAAPAALRGLLASTGESGPVALAEGGAAWRVRVRELSASPVVPPAPIEAPPEPPPAETAEPTVVIPAPVVETPSPPPPVVEAPQDVPGEPGTVSGILKGAAVGEVAAILFLGPDNVLREAARVAPDAEGRYRISGLSAGAYRIVANGKGGRVLICQPPSSPFAWARVALSRPRSLRCAARGETRSPAGRKNRRPSRIEDPSPQGDQNMPRFGFLLAALCVAAPALAADVPAADVAATVKAAMDTKADPCQDFYQYACGTWRETAKLPADQVRWGRGFSEITERNRVINRAILEDAAKSPGDDPNRQKLGWFYGTCMDEAGIAAAGTKPVESWMKDAGKVKDAGSLMTTVGRLHAASIPGLFGLGVEGDFKDPNTNIGQMFQGGLNLPDRDYYLSEDEAKKDIRDKYVVFVAKMFEMYGEKPESAKAMAGRVLAFETELAKNSRPRAELRDPDKIYNKLDRVGLQKLTPKLDWDGYFKALGHPEVTQINVAVPEFFQGLEKLAFATDAATLQAYLQWNVLHDAAPALPKNFDEENFNFYGKTLQGQQEQQPRWKRCVAQTDGALGEILGQEFIKKQFAGDSKKIARELIETIQTAFANNLPQLEWMDDITRQRALGKKGAIANKIGYPDKWRDYSKLKIKKGDYFGNLVAAGRFDFEREAAKIGKPVDKTEWGMTPPTVNAYYNPLNNEMAFPAGILQPPFFSKEFPAAMNYGGIGMVMGHELTHGFDDQGRKFDAQGKLTEWWEPSVSTKFEERAACIERQYGNYEVQPDRKLNGKLTLGENIADNGGIKEAYSAYKAYEAAHPGTEKPAVPGLTNDQLLFVAFAQTWCSLATPEIERVLVTVDPHSPPRFRVNGPLSNYDQFAQTFQCAEGTPMRPKDACEVW